MVKHRQYTYFYIFSCATLNETFRAKCDIEISWENLDADTGACQKLLAQEEENLLVLDYEMELFFEPCRELFFQCFTAHFCRRQEEHAILISRLLSRMHRMYVARIHLDFH